MLKKLSKVGPWRRKFFYKANSPCLCLTDWAKLDHEGESLSIRQETLKSSLKVVCEFFFSLHHLEALEIHEFDCLLVFHLP